MFVPPSEGAYVTRTAIKFPVSAVLLFPNVNGTVKSPAPPIMAPDSVPSPSSVLLVWCKDILFKFNALSALYKLSSAGAWSCFRALYRLARVAYNQGRGLAPYIGALLGNLYVSGLWHRLVAVLFAVASPYAKPKRFPQSGRFVFLHHERTTLLCWREHHTVILLSSAA